MADAAEQRFRIAVVSWMTMALGGFGLFRLIPEVIGVKIYLGQESLSAGYVAILVLDAVLGAGAIMAGWGLRRKFSWPPAGVVSIGSAVAVNSALVLRVAVRQVLSKSWIPCTLLLIPRMAFNVFTLVPAPYSLCWLYAQLVGSGPSRKVLTACVVTSSALSALLISYALDLYPFGPR